MNRIATFLITIWCAWQAATGQPVTQISYHYDEEDGLPHSHVTQLLQDELGFIWFATWNGLCRFDGYEFCTFKSQPGDGCHMLTDRFRDIALRPDGNIVCRVDEHFYLFDTRTCRFSDMTENEASQAAEDILRYRMSQAQRRDNKVVAFTYTDHQGNLWATCPQGISKQTRQEQRTQRLDIEPKAEVKCLFVDSMQRYWVATKDDAAIRIYSGNDDRLLGYLGRDGQLHQQHTSFGSAIYCMYQSADGTLWLGSKPDGLFRLHETTDHQFRIEQVNGLSATSVYHLHEDRFGRLWIATLDSGLWLTTNPMAEQPQFTTPANYPQDKGQKLRYLYIADQGRVLMAAGTDGLMVSNIEQDISLMQFRQHQRESDYTESLSSSATMDIAEDGNGHIFVSTESSGINRITNSHVLDERLQFLHYTVQNHRLADDVIMSLMRFDEDQLLVVGGHTVSIFDTTGVKRVLDAHHFNSNYRFSEAHPQRLNGNRWLLGLTDGAVIIATPQMFQHAYQPKVVLTGISVQGGNIDRAVAYADSITLQPGERNLTVHFAAIDYTSSNRINYAFRLLPSEQWNDIRHDRSATLLDLKPGTYDLEIRSTDADGLWAENVRRLTIIVKPTFWESALGQILIFLFIIGTLALIVYTILYIRRIKRQQHETLEAYLALLEENSRKPIESPETKVKTDDPMLERVMTFIEQNIGNSEVSIGDMAAAAATSRSGLQRKLKQAMGITPQDLMHEARIKHAAQLLRNTDKTISEIAYACGFTDPKYFSRCFKKSIGQSPTEYKNASTE